MAKDTKKIIKEENNIVEEFLTIEEMLSQFEEKEVLEPSYISVDEVAHDGLHVKLNGKIYVVPPMSVAHAKNFEKIATSLVKDKKVKDSDVNMLIVYLAFKRNYKDVSIEWLEEYFDIPKLVNVMFFIKTGKEFKDVEDLSDEKKV